MFRLAPDETIPAEDGKVKGRFSMCRGVENPREIDVSIEWTSVAEDQAERGKGTRVYHMGA
eukprot:11186925-Lingulodinium_polyedra.AAC.1